MLGLQHALSTDVHVVPFLVGGAVIVVVGITLIPIGPQGDVLSGQLARLIDNLLLALLSGALLVADSLRGTAIGRSASGTTHAWGGALRLRAVRLGMPCTTVLGTGF